jgi:hypothetical protein
VPQTPGRAAGRWPHDFWSSIALFELPLDVFYCEDVGAKVLVHPCYVPAFFRNERMDSFKLFMVFFRFSFSHSLSEASGRAVPPALFSRSVFSGLALPLPLFLSTLRFSVFVSFLSFAFFHHHSISQPKSAEQIVFAQ